MNADVDPNISMPLTVEVSVAADRSICIFFAGEIDMMCQPQLNTLICLMTDADCTTACLDLGQVHFAGAPLLNFLAALHQKLPGTAIHLYRPTGLVMTLLKIAQLHTAVSVHHDRPQRGSPVLPPRPDSSGSA